MAAYTVTLKDRSTERIDQVDAYQQEGQMTTFFRLGPGRRIVDTWSLRVASFRTSEVVAVRRDEGPAPGGEPSAVVRSIPDRRSALAGSGRASLAG